MRLKLGFLMLCMMMVLNVNSQNETNKWVAGVSAAFAGYSKAHASLVGGQIAYQTPRFTLARYFKWNLTMVASFATAIGDTQDYTTFDGHLRYDFGNGYDKVVPYVMIGGSIIQALRPTPTLNFGVGNTFWISPHYGFNAQLIYKYSYTTFESQRSHVYPSVGIVYSFGARANSPRLWNRAH